MLVIFLDTETTGLDPGKHKPIEIAYKVMDLTSNKFILSYESYIAISREAWAEADVESINIHQLSYEQLLAGKTAKNVCAEITSDFNHLPLREKSGVFICQNPSFDRAFLNQIVPVDLQKEYLWPYHWLDLASMFWSYLHLKNDPLLNKLSENLLKKDQIANYFNLPKETTPHRAMNGVNHLIKCYETLFSQNSVR